MKKREKEDAMFETICNCFDTFRNWADTEPSYIEPVFIVNEKDSPRIDKVLRKLKGE